jgi:hypothetical protein
MNTLLSKETRNDIVNYIVQCCNNTRFSPNTIGIILRSFHMSAPIGFLLLCALAPKPIVFLTLFLLMIIFFLFFIFGGCFLSVVENRICKDDFTIADPFLELIQAKKSNKNRYNVSLLIGFIYYCAIGMIFYFRQF